MIETLLEALGAGVVTFAKVALGVIALLGLYELVCMLFVDPYRRWRDAHDALEREREARAWDDAVRSFRDDRSGVPGGR